MISTARAKALVQGHVYWIAAAAIIVAVSVTAYQIRKRGA